MAPMTHDPAHQWACSVAAEILNLGMLDAGDGKAVAFQRIQSVILRGYRLALMEQRERILTPSEN